MEDMEMDNGLELLKKVIRSNEENIDMARGLMIYKEDFIRLIDEYKSSTRALHEPLYQFESCIKNLPKSIEAHLSEQSILALERFEKHSTSIQYFKLGSVVLLLLSLLAMGLSFWILR